MMSRQNSQNIIFILVAMVIFWINLKAMSPTITAGDSSELSTAQSTLGIAHSPGYPFFVLTGKAFSTLVSLGNFAYRTNLFSVFCSAVIGWFACRLFFLWTESVFLSISATFFILFVPVVREQFLSTEVFALNMLVVFIVVFLLSKILFSKNLNSSRIFYLVALTFGLGLGNQHILIFLLPSCFLVLMMVFVSNQTDLKQFLRYGFLIAIFFAMGLTVYLFLPIRSFQQPFLDWEDPETLQRFRDVVTRTRYGMFQLAQGSASQLSLQRLIIKKIFFINELRLQMTLAITIMIMVGTVSAFIKKETRKFGYILILFWFLSGPFFLMLSNVGTESSGYEIVSRFLPMPFVSIFVLGVVGCSHRRMNIVLALLIFCSLGLMKSVPNLRNDFLVYDYGLNVLRTLPHQSLLFSDRADEVEFSLAYLLYADSKRKDLEFVDCNAGVTRSIYGDNYYKIWGNPRLAIREKREREIIQESNRPVYYATVDPDMIPIQRIAEGILYRAKPFLPISNQQIPWHYFYVLRFDSFHLGFRGVPLISSYAQLLGKYLLGQNSVDDSRSFFKMLSLLSPPGIMDHTIALWYLEKGHYKFSEEFFNRATQKDSYPDKVWCNFGLLYEKQGKNSKAEGCYCKAIQINSKSYQAHYNLGVLYWKQNRWQEVIREFKEVLRILPGHVDANRYLKIAEHKVLGDLK